MCGVAGIIGGEGNTQRVNAMLDRMPYRGPDDRGVWSEGQVTLGHLRLSIIDTSNAGHQPMHSEDGRFTLVFNGEIFNYVELRPDLERRGSTFRSQSDSEVIIEAYRHHGAECLKLFNGMWAFALWDKQEQTLFLARDRFGVKPLYYTLEDGELCFASEMKALLALKKREPNWPYYLRFFERRTPLGSDETVFTGIRHLRPAHALTWKQGRTHVLRHWSADRERILSAYAYEDPVREVRTLVDDAVRLRLRSDVPVGICLSGGVDSSVIAMSLATQGVKPETFSSVYREPECDESRFMDAVNEACGANPHRIVPKPEDFFAVMERIVHHHDEPVRMPGNYSHWHVMKCAQGHVTVLLDGQGGDEVFGGYQEFYAPYIASLLADILLLRSPSDAAARLQECLAGLRQHLGNPGDHVLRAVKLFLPRTLARALGKKRLMQEVFSPEFAAAHAQPHDEDAQERARLNALPSFLDRAMFETFAETNLPMLLRYEDRNSMAFSLEARTPFLDYRVVEYALGLSYRWKMRGFSTKHVLREAYKDVLPASVLARTDKKGFPTPTAQWLRGPLHQELRSLLLGGPVATGNVFNVRVVERLLTEHATGRKNHERLLFRLLTFHLWAREHGL